MRFGAIAMLPIDGVSNALHGLSAKATCLAMGAYGQAASLLGRVGIGGAAAGGGIASLGGKATAVCVGVVCAATAGGEIAGVHAADPDRDRASDERGNGHAETVRVFGGVGRERVGPQAAPVAPIAPPPAATTTTHHRRSRRESAPSSEKEETPATETPGDLPSNGPADPAPAGGGGSQQIPAPTQASAGTSTPRTGSKPASETKKPNCVPGDLGC